MFWRLRSLMLGIILGLLFSPGTGAENRRRAWIWLQGKAGETAPKVQTQLQQVANKGAAVASQTLDQARQQVGPITQRAQETLSNVGQTAQQKIGQATKPGSSPTDETAEHLSAPPSVGIGPMPTPGPTVGPSAAQAEQSARTTLREVDPAEGQTGGPKQ